MFYPPLRMQQLAVQRWDEPTLCSKDLIEALFAGQNNKWSVSRSIATILVNALRCSLI